MTEGETHSRPRGMYTRAFRRAEAEAQQPVRPPVPLVATVRETPLPARSIDCPPIAAPPAVVAPAPRPRPQPRPRRDPHPQRKPRIASLPLDLRAAITLTLALTLAAVLAPLARSSGAGHAEATAPAVAAEEIADLRDIELPASTPAVPAPTTGPAHGPAPRPESPEARARTPVDGGLVVETRPAGARVTVNGIGYGETPLRIDYLPFGTKRIRVIKEGYDSVERAVHINAGTPRPRLQITLRELEPTPDRGKP